MYTISLKSLNKIYYRKLNSISPKFFNLCKLTSIHLYLSKNDHVM